MLSIQEVRAWAHVLDLVPLAEYEPLHAAPGLGPGGALGGELSPSSSAPSSKRRSA